MKDYCSRDLHRGRFARHKMTVNRFVRALFVRQLQTLVKLGRVRLAL